MGERGPAPRRDDERRRRNKPAHPIVKMGPQQLQELPFEVDLEPTPPLIEDGNEEDAPLHPVALAIWEGLLTDPARKWMTSADWAAAWLVCESISRDLRPQVVGVSETTGPIRDLVPVKGGNLTAYLKFFSMIGVTEASRLRIQKEITLFPTTEVQTSGNVVNIRDARESEVQ